MFPKILKSIDSDISNTVFSYIPNTAETSFYGMTEAAEDLLNQQKTTKILAGGTKLSAERVTEILSERPRFEKIAIKDAKLRTFIAEGDIPFSANSFKRSKVALSLGISFKLVLLEITSGAIFF